MIIALIAATLTGEAAAADTPRMIPSGSTVRIVSVSRKDAFWRFRTDLVDQACLVTDPGLVRHKGRWYGGAMTCEDGQPYYFYQVEVSVGDYGSALVRALPAPDPAPPETDPAAPTVRAVPPSPLARTSGARVLPMPSPDWPAGARGKITAVSPADATAESRPSVVGLTCVVTDTPLMISGEGWLSGGMSCDNGADLFFYQVALAPAEAAEPTRAQPSRKADGRLQGDPIPAGRLVRVVDLSPVDQHYAERAALIGKTCTVAEAPLVPSGEAWYAGRLFCGAGEQWQLYQVAVAPN